MKIRVELPDCNVHKLDTNAMAVSELHADIQAKFSGSLPESFLLHYFDTDFGNFFTLGNDEEIVDKMTVKVVAVLAPNDEAAGDSHDDDAVGEISSASAAVAANLWQNESMQNYVLPHFDRDIELTLTLANEEYQRSGKITKLGHGVLSRILTRMSADIYENYSAYPNTAELEMVAKLLTAKYEGIKDTGRGHEAWWNRLIFKMGNYRSLMRRRGSLEMSVHGGKRSKYASHRPPARKGMKKLKPGVINWQPEFPSGEDETSLKKHQADMVAEMRKGNPDKGLLSQKMAVTFALRRRYINQKVWISDLQEKWPALFRLKPVSNYPCYLHVRVSVHL